jgi:acetylglutamate synthase
MRPSEIVHRFLASIGRPDAVAQYLRIFQSTSPERFALVFVSESVVKNSSSALVADLVFLHQLELTPVLAVEEESQRKELVAALPVGFPIFPCQAHEVAAVAADDKIPVLLAPDASARNSAAETLTARKLIYLIDQSGLQPSGEEVRSLINLRTDYGDLARTGVLSADQQELLEEIRELFANSEHTFTVSVTSAQDLLRELFTLKGAGTLLRRGTDVQRLDSYAQLDRDRFAGLLHSAFHRTPADSFYDRPVLRVFLATEYRGAAVIEERAIAPYLSKFAVDLRAQGEGIGGDLWRALCADYERFYWRSRPDNPIASWYASECDGLVRGPEWTVYWRGLGTSEIARAVEDATRAPIDFEGAD